MLLLIKKREQQPQVLSLELVGGETDITIATTSVSGGAEPETIQSIKYNAPLDFASQQDEALLMIIKLLFLKYLQTIIVH